MGIRRTKSVGKTRKMENLLWQFRSLVKDDEKIEPEDIWRPFEKFIWVSMAPEKAVGNDRPCGRADFADYIPLAKVNLKLIESFLRSLVVLKSSSPQSNIKLKKGVVVSLLLLCGEHGEDHAWTSDGTRQLVRDILLLTCELTQSQTVKDLLVREKLEEETDNSALFKPCLLGLRPKLLKETWKKNPAAVACFCWLLQFVKSPHMGDHLNIVLPTVLLMVDDFVPENRLQGIKCVVHVVDNVPRTRLSWYGQADVLYDALFRLLYNRDEVMMEALLECITLVLEKLEGGPDGAEQRLEWSRYDAVVQVILEHMALEDKIVLRTIYARALSPLLRAMGFAVARWLRRLSIALKHYFETAVYATEECTMAAFEVLRAMEDACPERLPMQAIDLSNALIRLLVDMQGHGPTAPVADAASPALVAAAKDALCRMMQLIPTFARDLVKSASDCYVAPPVQKIIRDIIAPTVEAIQVSIPYH